jgi:hypothetical protein
MPHWINLSFYSKAQRSGVCYRNFTPRVRLPNAVEHLIPDDKNSLTDDYYPRIQQLPILGK